MSTTSRSDVRIWISAPSIAERFDVSDKTIARWERNAELGFPRATLINKRKFFRLDEVEAWERSQVSRGREELGGGRI